MTAVEICGRSRRAQFRQDTRIKRGSVGRFVRGDMVEGWISILVSALGITCKGQGRDALARLSREYRCGAVWTPVRGARKRDFDFVVVAGGRRAGWGIGPGVVGSGKRRGKVGVEGKGWNSSSQGSRGRRRSGRWGEGGNMGPRERETSQLSDGTSSAARFSETSRHLPLFFFS